MARKPGGGGDFCPPGQRESSRQRRYQGLLGAALGGRTPDLRITSSPVVEPTMRRRSIRARQAEHGAHLTPAVDTFGGHEGGHDGRCGTPLPPWILDNVTSSCTAHRATGLCAPRRTQRPGRDVECVDEFAQAHLAGDRCVLQERHRHCSGLPPGACCAGPPSSPARDPSPGPPLSAGTTGRDKIVLSLTARCLTNCEAPHTSTSSTARRSARIRIPGALTKLSLR